MSTQDTEKYLLDSIRLAMGNIKNRERATWPFGAVLVRGGQVLARAVKWHSEHRVVLNGHKTVIFK